MRGLELHHNLESAEFVEEAHTAPIYRLYSIGDRHPGMFEVGEGGISVPGEVYRMSAEVWRQVEAGAPPHLYKGPVRPSDSRVVDGIPYPRELAERRHRAILGFAGWRGLTAGRGPGGL